MFVKIHCWSLLTSTIYMYTFLFLVELFRPKIFTKKKSFPLLPSSQTTGIPYPSILAIAIVVMETNPDCIRPVHFRHADVCSGPKSSRA